MNERINLSLKPDDGKISVTVDYSAPVTTSRLQLGVTFTHLGLDNYGDPKANIDTARLFTQACKLINVHIHGWGVECPECEKGKWDWTSLDRRVNFVRSLGYIPILTLCAAPDWMKGPYSEEEERQYMEHGQQWWWFEKAPLPEFFDDYAQLAVEAAKRYRDIAYYQIWNEMKGFVHEDRNYDFDDHQTIYYEEYTEFYNKIYDALKQYDPSLKVGGFYPVIQGTGSNKGGWASEAPIIKTDREAMEYWLKYKHGADFICVDRGVKGYWDKNTYTADKLMDLTENFYLIAEQIREVTDLPIWWSEYYSVGIAGTLYQAANAACILYYMLKGGSAVGLLWNPIANEGLNTCLFSDTETPEGGQPTPYYHVFRAFNVYFGAGTPIYKVSCSMPEDVIVIASDKKTMLVNKRKRNFIVNVNGIEYSLGAYQVIIV